MAIKHMTIPNPPKATDPIYRSNQFAFNRAVEDWCARVKQQLENNSLLSQQPAGPIVLSTGYTATSTVGTSSSVLSVSNMLCTLVNALTVKGLLTPRSSQG